jgi:hypothetical protein
LFAAVMIVVGTILGNISVLAAQEGPGRVVIAPQSQVFASDDGEQLVRLRQALHSGFHGYVRAHPEHFTLVDEAFVHHRLKERPLYEGTVALARQWAEMGMESFKRLQVREAIGQLEKAFENFEAMGYEMVAPSELAELLLYLSLSYLEEGANVVRPLEVMQAMIALDPSLILRPGYYPEYIVHFYQNARNALYQDLFESAPRLEQARALAEIAEADYVVYAYATPLQAGASRLISFMYVASEDRFLDPEVQLVGAPAPANLSEGASRLMSRYAACLFAPAPEAPAVVTASRGDGPLSVQIQGAYTSFLQYPAPIESTFGNYGISLGVTYLLTREFGLTGRLQILNSMRDYNGILRDDFTTLRGFVGPRLAWTTGAWTLGMDTALEVTSVGPIRAFGDKNCIPAPEVLCRDGFGTVVLDGHGTLLGVNLRPQLGYRLAAAMELVVSLSASYFVYPLTERILNFPLSSEVGIQYRF